MMKTSKAERAELARAVGRSWAEQRAETLQGSIPAEDWPDAWDDGAAGSLPFSDGELDEGERPSLKVEASHEAREYWRRLVVEARFLEDLGEAEQAEEAWALHLVDALNGDLPQGLTVQHDAGRVYVVDREGFERTISSLRHAWQVVNEYEERRTLNAQ